MFTANTLAMDFFLRILFFAASIGQLTGTRHKAPFSTILRADDEHSANRDGGLLSNLLLLQCSTQSTWRI